MFRALPGQGVPRLEFRPVSARLLVGQASAVVGELIGEAGRARLVGADDTVVGHELFNVLADRPWSSIATTQPLLVSPTGPPPGPLAPDGAELGALVRCASSGPVELLSASDGTVMGTVRTAAASSTRPLA
jgi:hypothetical protein